MSDTIRLKGFITQDLKGDYFLVKINDENYPNNDNKEIKCVYSGKLKKNKIRLLVGDIVEFELSTYNLDLGRIVYRYK